MYEANEKSAGDCPAPTSVSKKSQWLLLPRRFTAYDLEELGA